MPSRKAANRKLPRVPQADTSQYVDDGVLEVTEDGLEDARFTRLSDGCLELSSGGFLRMRPPGFGPDFDSDVVYFD
jgi:hypothetical protein